MGLRGSMISVDPSAEGERLQKVMAAAGVASRRASEDLIAQGRVTVNGEKVTEPGRRVLSTDLVTVDGVAIQLDTTKRYVMLNKPVGVVSSLADESGRPDLRTFTRDYPERLFNVGRLDAATSGVLVGKLKTDPTSTPPGGVAKDFFAGKNVLSIVLSVDKSLLNAGGPILSAWASTNKGS